ncbi:MAG TPA: hypothetical protein VFN35_10360 [Ktedonobacteraceae bacterium]|nr:hypothetical protein [Ktedonobacteraceae bacterium]
MSRKRSKKQTSAIRQHRTRAPRGSLPRLSGRGEPIALSKRCARAASSRSTI